MFGSKANEPDVKMVFCFAVGTTGILANLCLIAWASRSGLWYLGETSGCR
jgi:hypothetical protein